MLMCTVSIPKGRPHIVAEMKTFAALRIQAGEVNKPHGLVGDDKVCSR